MSTDRGDALRSRYSYYRDAVTGSAASSQLDGNLEIVVIPGLKAGYFARYNFDYDNPYDSTTSTTGDFIEQRLAFRITPDCDCWYLDLGYIETSNPDRQVFAFSFNFGGLGALDSGVLVNKDDETATR
jgi:hypothetical protein